MDVSSTFSINEAVITTGNVIFKGLLQFHNWLKFLVTFFTNSGKAKRSTGSCELLKNFLAK